MKILMRADTHVSFSVPAEEPKAKCTNSQANNENLRQLPRDGINFNLKFSEFPDLGSFISITRIDGGRLLIRLHIAGISLDARPQSHQLRRLGPRSEYSVEFSHHFLLPRPTNFFESSSTKEQKEKIDFSIFFSCDFSCANNFVTRWSMCADTKFVTSTCNFPGSNRMEIASDVDLIFKFKRKIS